MIEQGISDTVTAELAADKAFQSQMLGRVSRSFALTIPQLPDPLRLSVSTAYLLCRLVDTLEDEPTIDAMQTRQIFDQFLDVLRQQNMEQARAFCQSAHPQLTDATSEAERELMAQADRVMRVYWSLPETTRDILYRCVDHMCMGMPEYQPDQERGLQSQTDLDYYCYFVAGVVGEMLTELFCDYAEDIAEHKAELTRLSPSFGQGLQMTNILKDVWDDLDRGFCWLPRDIFTHQSYDLDKLAPDYRSDEFRRCNAKLIAVTHGHLRNALNYSLCIPARHRGIRIFCLWAIGLALPTLQRVYRSDEYYQGQTVKMAKSQTLLITQYIALFAGKDQMLKPVFNLISRGLPMAPVSSQELSETLHQQLLMLQQQQAQHSPLTSRTFG